LDKAGNNDEEVVIVLNYHPDEVPWMLESDNPVVAINKKLIELDKRVRQLEERKGEEQ
jgi:hypothetical protein